jgi:hypothetical protein
VSLRQQLSETWGADVKEWWFPDGEGCPDVVRRVREFIKYRNIVPKDEMEQHLQHMSGLFRTMDVSEHGSSPSTDAQSSPHRLQSVSFESSPQQKQWQG